MKSRFIIYFAINVSLLQGLSSCNKDFLNVPDKSKILRQEYVTDLGTTGEFLNGIYIDLASFYYHGYNLIYADLVSDNIKPAAGSSSFVSQYNWEQQSTITVDQFPTSETVNMNPIWGAGYKIARSCSFVLEKADEYRNEDPQKSDLFKGQALALRGLVHFMMANIFAQSYNFTNDASHAGIPYVTTSDWTQPVTRQTIAEVYANLITDLNEAISLLPSGIANTQFMNSNAAKALLARVYLVKGDYAAARILAKAVTDIVPIMTSDYPNKLYTLQETEALFQLPPEATYYFTQFAGLFCTPNYGLEFFATNDIASIFLEYESDKRRSWVTKVSGDWYITKFTAGVVGNYPIPEGAYYQTVLRSSEMYLTAAESYAKIGNGDSARFFLNAIRERAGITIINSSIVGPALLDSIYKERRRELAFEGFRMFDLLRWKQGVERMDASTPAVKSLPYPSDRAIAPIPESEVDLSGLSQNASY